MNKQKIITGCMLALALVILVMAWHAPVNQGTMGNMGDIHTQGSGYMTSTSTLADCIYVYSGRGAKGYFTLSGNSCDIEMNVYIYSSQAYSRYSSGQNVTPYRTFRLYPSRRWTLIAPSSDYWYAVYRPATSFSGSIYVYTYSQADYSGPAISTNLQNMLNINSSFTIQANATDLFQVSYIGIEINGDLKTEAFNSSTISYTWTPDTSFQQINTVKLTSWDQFGQTTGNTYYIIGADRTPPVVTWNSQPTTVSGSSFYLSISYSDNVALKRFRVLMNGSQLYNEEYSSSSSYYASDSAYLYWNTLAVANGLVKLTAIAWDQKGLNTTSSITVKVDNDRTAPSISWDTTVTTVSGSYVPVKVSVSDDHQVYRVELYVNGYERDYSYPYSQATSITFHFNSEAYSNGQVLVQVVAYDAAGNSNTISRYVTINNDDTDPTASWQTVPSEFKGTTKFSVKVWDDTAIELVKFYASKSSSSYYYSDFIYEVDNPSNNAILQFSLDTTRYSDGSLCIIILVRDTSGNEASSYQWVTVKNAGGTTTPTPTNSSSANMAPLIIGVLAVVFAVIFLGMIATVAAKKKSSSTSHSLSSSSSTSHSLFSSSNTSPAGRTAVPARSSTSSRPSTTASSTSNRPSRTTTTATSNRPSTTTTSSRSSTTATQRSTRRSSSFGVVRSNLPASCFVPTIRATPRANASNGSNSSTNVKPSTRTSSTSSRKAGASYDKKVASSPQSTSWNIIDGIRTPVVPAKAGSKKPSRAKTSTRGRAARNGNQSIAPKTSRMYVDGACFNDVKPWTDVPASNAPASVSKLFCKVCMVPVVPDPASPGTAETCKTCGSVLMHLVPISALPKRDASNECGEYDAFEKAIYWMITNDAIPVSGRITMDRLQKILHYTGNDAVSLEDLIDKMLRLGLIAAKTAKTVVLSKGILANASAGTLSSYLKWYQVNSALFLSG